MASHSCPAIPVTSPKKKKGTKSKRRADDDAATGIAQVQKHSKNTSADEVPASQPRELEPRRSGRPGAGSGGRAVQLGKLGSVLEAPPVKKSKNVTDIPDGTIDNPLAPEKPRRRRGTKKVCFDLHSSSSLLTLAESNPPPPYPAVVTETPGPIPAPTAPLPGFHQRTSDSQCFGFIVPPGTEPDLQALNNPYYAAAQTQMAGSQRSQVSSCAPSHLLSRQPSVLDVWNPVSFQSLYGISYTPHSIPRGTPPGITNSQIDPSLLSNFRSSSVFPMSRPSQQFDANHHAATDVSMFPNNSSSDSKSSEPGSGGDKRSQISGENDSDGGVIEGWGATQRQETTHLGMFSRHSGCKLNISIFPGFSQENQTSIPVPHVPLPVETEFDHSCDEGDDAAQ
jgi:hypothetical protein